MLADRMSSKIGTRHQRAERAKWLKSLEQKKEAERLEALAKQQEEESRHIRTFKVPKKKVEIQQIMDQEEDDGLGDNFKKYRRRKSLYKILTDLVPDRLLSHDPPSPIEKRERRTRKAYSYR